MTHSFNKMLLSLQYFLGIRNTEVIQGSFLGVYILMGETYMYMNRHCIIQYKMLLCPEEELNVLFVKGYMGKATHKNYRKPKRERVRERKRDPEKRFLYSVYSYCVHSAVSYFVLVNLFLKC